MASNSALTLKNPDAKVAQIPQFHTKTSINRVGSLKFNQSLKLSSIICTSERSFRVFAVSKDVSGDNDNGNDKKGVFGFDNGHGLVFDDDIISFDEANSNQNQIPLSNFEDTSKVVTPITGSGSGSGGGTRAGLFRTPISGGVQSATSAHGLPRPALAVRNLMEQIKDLSRPAAYFVVLVAATVASYHYGASRKPVKPLTPIKSSNVHNYKLQDVKYFSDVRGCDSAKAKLEVIVDMIRNADRFMRLGAELPKGILLSGPPGTGKTLLAKAIAGEAGVPFLYRAGSEFEERLVGVGAERVRALFRDARKRAPCIVFIDEIDAFAMSRKNGRGDGSTTLLQFLAEMDGVVKSENVLVIAATNVPSALDEALKRSGRFDMHIEIPFPDAHGREDLFELYLEGKHVEDSVSVKELARATPKFSGADIRNMINFAAIKAATEYADCISLEHLEGSSSAKSIQ